MQQIADWLKKLGMPEYAERFAENDIDMAVLADLTDQHFKDLGVSLGHRLKMLRAIRDLSGASTIATAPSAPMAPPPSFLRICKSPKVMLRNGRTQMPRCDRGPDRCWGCPGW